MVKLPISPPSNPRQYRAIGLIRGRYEMSPEKINRGFLVDSKGRKIRVVLLRRVISLIRQHLDLSKEYLWVVYPRTKIETGELHLQIVGVWEPKTLAQNFPDQNLTSCQLEDRYFSVRGEVVGVNLSHRTVIVKIRQKPRGESKKLTFFKLKLYGILSNNAQGHFWDLDVHLDRDRLVIKLGTDLGSLINPLPKAKPLLKPSLQPKTDIGIRRTRKVPSRKPRQI
ncbi:hypothetical protein [Gloeocapsa sp. PCC 73106]|uniref:hypothetical protein n=1 Tax=Gloeocapsa sp. PCC 73106 TaxID=102232 RepID=UPI0002ACB73B|nr:hypothetical protein [Gloeocapsa sp. PCC 73106]ELR99412.1 hypothetical protein GLO73106DRAFT_00032630 [Gloeocapsa sp. PCC 73106]